MVASQGAGANVALETTDLPGSGRDERLRIRRGDHTGGTAGLALGYLQANLVVLPEEWAIDFARFCLANPRPCPVVGVSNPGDPSIPALGDGLDIRFDVPQFNVYEDGQFTSRRQTLEKDWRDDFVAFALGCSYTFERALMAEGIALRHIDEGRVVPMYRTSLATVPAGPFSGGTVVSMRPLTPENAERAAEITARFPYAHGAPVHTGDPEQIGITDLSTPDWGDDVLPRDGEVPVFWACGVTPQLVVENAKPPVCITHRPGHMLITDVTSDHEAEKAREVAMEQLYKLGRQ